MSSNRTLFFLALGLFVVPLCTFSHPILFDAAWVGSNTGQFPDGFGPSSFAFGDLDGDGDEDALVGQGYFGGPGVSVLLNNGNGTFAPPLYTALPMNDSVGRVTLGDIDDDGDLDALATIPNAWQLGNQVALWRNDGLGVLGPATQLTVGSAPVSLALVDLNRDGHADLVIANTSDDTISILRHNGLTGAAASFLPAVPVVVGWYPQMVRFGDLDRDGNMDLAVATADPAGIGVMLLFGDGAMGFRVPIRIPAGTFGGPVIALADMDRDGDLDIVAGRDNEGPPTFRSVVKIIENDGSGAFNSLRYAFPGASPDPVDIAVGDLNGDDYPDIVEATPNGRDTDGWAEILSDGAGGFLAGTPHPATQNSESIALVDVERDGDLDVATLGRYSAALTISFNPGTGVYRLPTPYPVDGFPQAIHAADIDLDNDLDVVTATSSLQVHRNQGGGSFATPVTVVTGQSIYWVKLRDLTGDGYPDLLMSSGSAGGFAVAANRGDGTFMTAAWWTSDPCAGPVDAFDFDRDGDRDVVMTSCMAGFDAYRLVARNDGTGNFTGMPHLPGTLSGNTVEAADLNSDGNLDLVTNDGGGMGIASYLGNGDLTFQPEVISGDPAPLFFTLGEFTGDGIIDAGVVIGRGSFGTDLIAIEPGLGDGRFGSAGPTQPGSSTLENLSLTSDLIAGDVDCDGLTDLVTTCFASNDHGVFLSRGDGTLATHQRYGSGMVPKVSVFGDFTGDNRIDLATIAGQLDPCCGYAMVVLPGLCNGCSVPDTVPPDQGNVVMAVKQFPDVALSWQGTAASLWRVYRDRLKTSLRTTRVNPDLSVESMVDFRRIPGNPIDFYRVAGLSPCSRTAGP